MQLHVKGLEEAVEAERRRADALQRQLDEAWADLEQQHVGGSDKMQQEVMGNLHRKLSDLAEANAALTARLALLEEERSREGRPDPVQAYLGGYSRYGGSAYGGGGSVYGGPAMSNASSPPPPSSRSGSPLPPSLSLAPTPMRLASERGGADGSGHAKNPYFGGSAERDWARASLDRKNVV